MNTKLGIYVVADVVSSLVGEVLMLWVYALGEKSENFPSDFLKLIWGFKCLCHRNSKALQNRMMINEAAKRGLRIIFFKLFMKMKQFDSFSHSYPKKHRNHKLIFIVLFFGKYPKSNLLHQQKSTAKNTIIICWKLWAFVTIIQQQKEREKHFQTDKKFHKYFNVSSN